MRPISPLVDEGHPILGVLLAGGEQRRLTPLGLDHPKALLTPGEIPVGRIVLRQMLARTSEAVVMGGRDADTLEAELAGPSVRLATDPALGTGTAAWIAAHTTDRPLLLFANADTLNEETIIARVVGLSTPPYADAIIGLTRRTYLVQNAGAFAVDNQGRVMRSFEDGRGGSPPLPGAAWHGSSTGVILVPRALMLDVIGSQWQDMKSLERDVIPAIIRQRKLLAADCGPAFSLDLGTPERLAALSTLRSEVRRIEADSAAAPH